MACSVVVLLLNTILFLAAGHLLPRLLNGHCCSYASKDELQMFCCWSWRWVVELSTAGVHAMCYLSIR
eukprot:11299594-Ditylum_brightwellii.AAC.1